MQSSLEADCYRPRYVQKGKLDKRKEKRLIHRADRKANRAGNRAMNAKDEALLASMATMSL